MQSTTSRWRFSVAVLLPVVAAVGITLVLAAGFVIWSAQRTDQRALDRQEALAAKAIITAKSDFETSQTDEVLRYEAVNLFTDGKPDHDDIDGMFGADEYDTYGHDRVYILDPNLKPIYAARNGEDAGIKVYDGDRAVIDPLAVRFRAPELQAEIDKYQSGRADYPPQVSDIVTFGGRVAMVSVLPIVSNWDDQTQKFDNIYYHVALSFAGTDLAQDMMDTYQFDAVHIDTVPNTMQGEALVPISNEAGRFVAWFKWKPDRPGQALLSETLPASLGLIAVISIVLSLLLWGLARSTRQLEKARAEALFRATHDPLTGLANRALFNETLERSPLPLTLLALDLDRFKAVNDTLGHEAGDELLRQVAGRLTDIVRETDLVARLGGDEFMILLFGRVDADHTQVLASRVVGALAEPFMLGADLAHIGVSVGIATAITDQRRELVSRADFALYNAKESGRNTYRIFDEERKAA